MHLENGCPTSFTEKYFKTLLDQLFLNNSQKRKS